MATTPFNHFPDIANALPNVLSQVVRKTALDLEAQAKQQAPVDTGFLRNSIYTKTAQDSDYSGSTSEKSLPEVEAPPDPYTAYVAVGASYGAYVELGTRFQPPQPYLVPAAEAVRPGYEDALSNIESQLKGTGSP